MKTDFPQPFNGFPQSASADKISYVVTTNTTPSRIGKTPIEKRQGSRRDEDLRVAQLIDKCLDCLMADIAGVFRKGRLEGLREWPVDSDPEYQALLAEGRRVGLFL